MRRLIYFWYMKKKTKNGCHFHEKHGTQRKLRMKLRFEQNRYIPRLGGFGLGRGRKCNMCPENENSKKGLKLRPI